MQYNVKRFGNSFEMNWTEPNWTKGSRQQLTSHEQRWMGTHNIQNISWAYKKTPLSPTKFWKEEISKFIKDLITTIKLLHLEKFYFKTNNIFERKYKYVHRISILNILLKEFLNVIITAFRLSGFSLYTHDIMAPLLSTPAVRKFQK